MHTFDFLDTNKPLYCALLDVIARGTARILSADASGVFLQDTVSGVYMLASATSGAGIRMMDAHPDEPVTVFTCYDPAIVDHAGQVYHLTRNTPCLQAVWLRPDMPAADDRLTITPARPDDLPFVSARYKLLDTEELAEVIREGKLFLAYAADDCIGFIGEHLEGSMGLLEILPDFRRKGYGRALEIFMIRHHLQASRTPYCHVICGNDASLALQENLGMTICPEKVYWCFRGE
ncbi:MAG: GNAT family N-acetyltransferase [Clostridia bacterium]|nr:GNAT family N-acetyltransferase [Clostridia bacterium]